MLFGTYKGKAVRKNRKKLSKTQNRDIMIIGHLKTEAIPLIQKEIRHTLDHYSNDRVYLMLPTPKDASGFDDEILTEVLTEFVDYTYYEKFFVRYDLDEIAETGGHIWIYFLGHQENNTLFHTKIKALREARTNDSIIMAFQYFPAQGSMTSLLEGIDAAYGSCAFQCSLVCAFKHQNSSISEMLKRYIRQGTSMEKVEKLCLEEVDADSFCQAAVVGKDEWGIYHKQGFS